MKYLSIFYVVRFKRNYTKAKKQFCRWFEKPRRQYAIEKQIFKKQSAL
jgi:hypothetical protein